MFKRILISFLLVVFFVCSAFAAEFPYRGKYPEVPFITTEDLATKDAKGGAVIVDVRSTIEYNVIHPTNAIHIPISMKNFSEHISKLMSQSPGKDIVFYCNGVECLKSYEAAEKAIKELKCDRCYAYDAGIPEWAEVYPDRTVLLGAPLKDPSKLISSAEFKAHCLPFDKFKEKAGEPGSLVIDVRDFIQASAKLPGLESARTIPLDKFIPNFIEKGEEKGKTLLIFDQVGKQIEWLMYYLKKYDYSKYAFLDGGATAVLGKQQYKK